MSELFKRTHMCGVLSMNEVNESVVLNGWVAKQRRLGGIIFVDLRDKTGIVQITFDDTIPQEVFDLAQSLRGEYVIGVKGTVRERSAKNPDIPTGDIEVLAQDLVIYSESDTPPIYVKDDDNVDDNLRLKYRYLDLRKVKMQRNLTFRHKITKVTRDYFDENGFTEVETPMLVRSTPEGARDYLVPSRVNEGMFYALPQSPQLFKQLLMVGGTDRYMQIAKCFRDEDLRADRQPEFTQIDLEMSFVDVDDVLELIEGFMKKLFKEAIGVDIETPLPRLKYKDAMDRYGSDKPDTRFAMELFDLSEIVKDCGFSVFESAIANGGTVRAFTAKNAVATLTRKEIDKLTEHAKGIGAKGLAWIRWTDDGIASSFGKFLGEGKMDEILAAAGAEKGDVVLIIADTKKTLALTTLGTLRCEVAKKLDIIGKGYNLLWIVEFPFFDWDEETQTWVAMHHPFTAPLDECLPYLESDKGAVRAKAYDLVLNGIELSSGSIRITNPELQSRIFSLLGLSEEEAQAKFGYLLDAFRFGPPPHGGMGIGLDRLVMQMLGAESLRDVIAYPKLKDATEAMTECPSPVDDDQLKLLGLSING